MKFSIKKNRDGKISAFGEISSRLIKEFGLEESYIIEEIKESWPEIVGEILSAHSIPDRIFKNTLFVFSDHSIYAGEISMNSSNIISKMNERYDTIFIKNIKVEIKRLKWNS